jgi:AcrR family transcriptional regulator
MSTRAKRKAINLPENETRRQIMKVAERLFAAHGFSGISLRSIVAEADVNLAAIHYHFGSKEALFEAVFERHAQRLAGSRMARLEQLVAAKDTPSLERVLEAFLAPALRPNSPANGGSAFARLRGRLIAENTEFGRRLQAKYFNQSSKGYLRLIASLVPHLPEIELYWRFNFMLGSMVYLMAEVRRIEQLSDGACDTSDVEERVRRLVNFYADAFRMPVRQQSALARHSPAPLRPTTARRRQRS